MTWIIRKFQGLRRRVEEAYWERRFRADTTGLSPAPGPDGHWYVTMPYRAIFQVLRSLELTSRDVLFDAGCGKGRVLLAAVHSAACKVVGVELNPELAEIARQHLARYQSSNSGFEIRNQNVLDVNYDEATALVMYDPFGAQTTRGVLARLQESIARRPRSVRVAFILSISRASLAELSSCGWLRCTKRFEVLTYGGEPQLVSVWHSEDASTSATMDLNGLKD